MTFWVQSYTNLHLPIDQPYNDSQPIALPNLDSTSPLDQSCNRPWASHSILRLDKAVGPLTPSKPSPVNRLTLFCSRPRQFDSEKSFPGDCILSSLYQIDPILVTGSNRPDCPPATYYNDYIKPPNFNPSSAPTLPPFRSLSQSLLSLQSQGLINYFACAGFDRLLSLQSLSFRNTFDIWTILINTTTH